MKIAFILSYSRIVPTDGIVSQAISWKKGLESLGHSVILIDMWNINNWVEYDVILFFGFSEYMRETAQLLSKINSNLVLAPIFDPNYNKTILKIYAHWGSDKLRLSNHYHALRNARNLFKKFLVRSEFEKDYLSDVFGISRDKCVIIPLAYQLNPKDNFQLFEKEDYCLHISLLCDQRKNVKRLIEASIKYNFKLKLCGILRNEEERQLLLSWIKGRDNIEYRGYVSKEEMILLYSKAKVFALPSLYEGVGIVALDAAIMGCDIVITKLGGPKEYYANFAKTVDPYDVNSIGNAIKSFLLGDSFQPQLSEYIRSHYNSSNLSNKLESALHCI